MRITSWLKGLRPVTYVPDASVTAAPILDFLISETSRKSPEDLWREQPHLRTVVDFLARNVAQLGVHAFELQDDGGRERIRHGVLPGLLRRPNPQQTGYEFWRAVVSDMALYDEAFMFVRATDAGFEIRTLRPSWIVGVLNKTAYTVDAYIVRFPDGDRDVEVPAQNVVHLHGWSPVDELAGSSPVAALRGILAEQLQAQLFREQVWRRGGRVGSYISRPSTAGKWSIEARNRFKEEWASAYSNSGEKAGGTPLLDDGMELKRIGFSAKEDQYVEGNKLSLATVAAVYHVNPTMVGLLDNANYSNVREFRRMLYGETLGPIIKQLEERMNAFLLPLVGAPDDVYVEFNTESRLRGSFEEQSQVMQTSIGGPWMTINEGRARQNLPAVDGGDELIRPLNVTQNGDHDPVAAADSGGEEGGSDDVDDGGSSPEDSSKDSPSDILARVNAASGLFRAGFDAQSAREAAGLGYIEHTGMLPITVRAADDNEAPGQGAQSAEEDT